MSDSILESGGNEIQQRLQKYVPELTFMLREFEKLESQLLAGNSVRQQQQQSSSDAQQQSRREKLRSFILHITDVISQLKKIIGPQNLVGGADASCKAKVVNADEDDKAAAAAELEQHILTSLLPVKDRLKKQLMNNAQSSDASGGSGNGNGRKGPIGGGPSGSTNRAMGTFAAAAAKKQQVHESVFGKPLSGGGSSLTQKLHGSTLGSIDRRFGSGVGQKKEEATNSGDGECQPKARPVQYAGMTSRVVGNSSVDASKKTETENEKSPKEVKVSLSKASAEPTGITTSSRSHEPAGEVVMPPPPPSASVRAAAAIRRKAAVAAAAAAATAAIVTEKVIKKGTSIRTEVESSKNLQEAEVELLGDGETSDSSSLAVTNRSDTSSLEIARHKEKKEVNDPTIDSPPLKISTLSENKSKMESINSSSKEDPSEVASEVTKQDYKSQPGIDVSKSISSVAKKSDGQTIVPVIQKHSRPLIKIEQNEAPDNDSKDTLSNTQPLHPAEELSSHKAMSKAAAATSSIPAPKHLDESTVVFLPSKSNNGSSKSRKRRRSFSAHSGPIDHSGSIGGSSYKKNSGLSPNHLSSQARSVEYICAMCNENYRSDCKVGNPWWALTQEACPKCSKTQIPRIDIGIPANAIEYHPALLAHADENNDGERGGDSLHAISASTEGDLDMGYDSGSESDDSEPGEDFGKVYAGPRLDATHAAQLLVLMSHASMCKGGHKSENHKQVCLSVKYLMLHVRDCPGTTLSEDLCPYPWCRKVKHLLYHLLSCGKPNECRICRPRSMPKNLIKLAKINFFQKQQARKRATQAALKSKGIKGGISELGSSNEKGGDSSTTKIGGQKKNESDAVKKKQEKNNNSKKLCEEEDKKATPDTVSRKAESCEINVVREAKEAVNENGTKCSNKENNDEVKLTIPINLPQSNVTNIDSAASPLIVTSSASSAVDSDNGVEVSLNSTKGTSKVSTTKQVSVG